MNGRNRGIGRDGRPDLVGTKEAAKRIGMHRSTLHAWWQAGRVTPDWITPGGHARWDVERLKRQLGITRRGLD